MNKKVRYQDGWAWVEWPVPMWDKESDDYSKQLAKYQNRPRYKVDPGLKWIEGNVYEENKDFVFGLETENDLLSARKQICIPIEPKPEHPENNCHKCGAANPIWSADNELWNEVVGSPNGILCPSCFEKTA